MRRETNRDLIQRTREVFAGQEYALESESFTQADCARALALMERGAECEGATEAFVAETDLHHVNDSHGTRRRVLVP